MKTELTVTVIAIVLLAVAVLLFAPGLSLFGL